MYGQAGHKHTPGMPYLSSRDAKEKRQEPRGVAGQRPLRNVDSKRRHKEAKRAKAD